MWQTGQKIFLRCSSELPPGLWYDEKYYVAPPAVARLRSRRLCYRTRHDRKLQMLNLETGERFICPEYDYFDDNFVVNESIFMWSDRYLVQLIDEGL